MRALMVVFEGHDGVGKSAIIREASCVLINMGFRVLNVDNPAPEFEKLRHGIDACHNLDISFKFYLMSSLHAMLCAEHESACGRYDIILIHRYIYSSLVSHQARGYQVPPDILDMFPKPALAFWIVTDEETRWRRVISRSDIILQNDKDSLNHKLIEAANQLYAAFDMTIIDNSGDLGFAVTAVIQRIVTELGALKETLDAK